ncbi:MAG: PAS domain-containing protein [Pseudomonadota bacterium]
MKHPNTKALYHYWEELRGERAAPYRSELDPRAISSLLESTFILEHPRSGPPRFRLAGTRLCDQFGMELRGMSALALWHGECRSKVKSLLADVVEAPCIGHVTCSVETRSGRFAQAEFLYLPLRSDLGDMTRILGCGHYTPGSVTDHEGSEPLHHWIEAVNVYAIASPEIGEGDGAVTPPPLTLTRRAADKESFAARRRRERRKPGDIADLRRLAPRRPTLKSIEGGLSGERDAAYRGLGAELRRLKNADECGGGRPHLRLVASNSADDRNGAA